MDMDPAKAFWATMTHGEKLFFVVANGNAASFAYERLQLHLEAARVQMSRIEEAIRLSESGLPEPSSDASQIEMRDYILRQGAVRMRPVLSDVHFYFVAWGGCRNMLETLVGHPEMLGAKRVFDVHRKEFEHYVAGRNSFEHYHDRLPGLRDEHRVREIQPDPNAGAHRVYSGFREGKYVHSNMEWDISRNSLVLLERIVEEVLRVVHATINEGFLRKGISA
jgi:hypothetical protein